MPDLSGIQVLGTSLDIWLDTLVLLLSFTLAIFVLLTLGVRALMIFRKIAPAARKALEEQGQERD